MYNMKYTLDQFVFVGGGLALIYVPTWNEGCHRSFIVEKDEIMLCYFVSIICGNYMMNIGQINCNMR